MMFYPDGFELLLDINTRCWELAGEWADNNLPTGSPENLECNQADLFYATKTERAYHDWLLSNFVFAERYRFFASSPQGVALRVSEFVMDRPQVFHGPFPADEAGCASLSEHCADWFLFVENETFTVCPNNYLKHSTPYELSKEAGLLTNCAGWPICWKLPNADFSNADLLTLINSSFPVPERPKGRPRKVDEVRTAYREHFPHGHRGQSAKKVAAKIRSESGLFFEIDTMRRALRSEKN